MHIQTTADLKTAIRQGSYTSVGGYPLALLTADGSTLHIGCARATFRELAGAMRARVAYSDWLPTATFANWENPSLYCDHCNERIESAYAEELAPCDCEDPQSGYTPCKCRDCMEIAVSNCSVHHDMCNACEDTCEPGEDCSAEGAYGCEGSA